MLIEVRESIRRFYVGFEIDNSVRFKKGPNKDRPQTVTTCKIYLVPNVRGRKPTYVAGGVTVLGPKDKPDVMEGLKFALTRALKKAKLGRYVNALIWSDFQITHRRINTINIGKPSNAELFSDEPVHDNSGHKFSNVTGNFDMHQPFPEHRIEIKPFVSYVSQLESGKPVTEHEAQTPSDKSQPSFYTGGPISPHFGHGGPVHGYGGLHAFQKKALEQVKKAGRTFTHIPPRHGLNLDAWKRFYGHRRHEYHDVPHKDLGKPITGRAARVYSFDGKVVNVRKIAGLGWTIMVNDATGEVIRPRSEAQKLQQLRAMYSFDITHKHAKELAERVMKNSRIFAAKAYSEQVHRAFNRDLTQAESRCHRVGQPAKPITIVNVANTKTLEAAMGGDGLKRVKEIISEANRYKHQRQWLRGLWKVSDGPLTAKMLGMHLTAAKEALKLDVELLSRPGITKVHDEYIIDPDVFVSEFCVGDIVTSPKFGIGKVTEIAGVFLTVQPGMRVGRELFGYGSTKLVPDWDCKKKVKVGWLRRARLRVRKWLADLPRTGPV